MSTGGGGGGAEFLGGIYVELGLDEKPAVDKFNKIEGIMEKVRQAAADLDAQIRAGKYAPGPELDAATAKLDHLQEVMDHLKTSQDQLASSAATAGAVMSKAGVDTNRFGQGLMQVGFMADDAAYGFRGLQNNIQPLVQSLTGNAGLAGAVGIVAVAGYQLYQHWDQLTELFGGKSAVKSAADEMKELAEATRRTVAETERLLVLRGEAAEKARGEAGARALPESGPEDTERGRAFSEAVGKAGGLPAVVAETVRAKPDLLESLYTPEDRERIAGARAEIKDAITYSTGEVKKTLTDREKELLKEAQEKLDAAILAANEEAKKELERRFGRAKGGGTLDVEAAIGLMPPDLAKGFLAVPGSAAAKAKKEADAKTVAEADEEARRIDEADAANLKKFNEARARRRKRVDELNRAGAENEAFALRQAQEFAPAVAEAMIAQHQDPAELERARKQRLDKEKADALKAAGEAIPDLAGQAGRMLLHAPGDEKDVDEAAAARLQAAMVSRGMGQDQAALAALLTVQDARKKFRDQAAKVAGDPFAMMDVAGGGGESRRTSQTMDSLSLVRAIQAGVGPNDLSRQQLQRLDRLVTIQAQLLSLQRNRRNGVFLPAQ